jgi:hypothetical protein
MGLEAVLLKQCVIPIVLVVFSGLFVAGTQSLFVGAQRPAVDQLSPEQRRAIQLLISTNGTSSGFFTRGPIPEKTSFKIGEPIHIGLLITNTGDASVRVCAFSNPYYLNRPQLTRAGETLVYSEKIRELIRQSDSGMLCEFTRTPDVVDLKSNGPLRVPSLELKEWYGPLSPGHYRLFLKRTLACCADGQWNSTNTISFDVTL